MNIGMRSEGDGVSEHPGEVKIRRFLDDLASDGADVIARYFTEDVVWHVGRGHPGNGTFQGLESLIRYYRDYRTTTPDWVSLKSVDVLADDSYGAVFVEVQARGEGYELELELPQLFKTGPDGLWSEYWILEAATKTPVLPRTDEDIAKSGFFNQYWYYSIELTPGLYTPGLKHQNLGLTRELLSRCEVEGRRCLDIGTMEAAVPILLSRRGAGQVIGVDVMECHQKVDAVKHYTDTEFIYHGGLTHQRTAPFLRQRYGGNFDLVVLSGVLYHCFGPLHVLAMARSLVRTGGVMVVETFAAIDKQQAMYFNAGGVLSRDASTYFLMSVPLLEYLLRYFKLEPLDCVAGPVTMAGERPGARVAVVCRATNELEAQDPWMQAGIHQVDYRTLIDWEEIDSGGANPPAYGLPASPFVTAGGGCDVTRTAFEAPALVPPERMTVVGMDDVY